MNEYDRKNLDFLLNASREDLRQWYNATGADDHEYAAELLAAYREELVIKQRFYEVNEADLGDSLTEAEEYLKNFMLGKKQ